MGLIIDIGQYRTPARQPRNWSADSRDIETRALEWRCDGGDGEDSVVLTLGRAAVKLLGLCSSAVPQLATMSNGRYQA